MADDETLTQVSDPRLLPGGNKPPPGSALRERLAVDHKGTIDEALKLLALAAAQPARVDTDEDEAKIAIVIRDIRATAKNVDSKRVSEKEPYLAATRDVDGFFVPVRERLEKAGIALNNVSTAYLQRKADAERQRREAEERARREEERRRQEEVAARLREAAEAQRKADEAARRRREEEDRAERERQRLQREEDDRLAREAAARKREEEEAASRAAQEVSRQKQVALDKQARERREREEREAAAAAERRREEEERAAAAKAVREQEEADARAEAERRMEEARRADEAAQRAESERLEAERAANVKPAELARTRSSTGTSTLATGWDFEIEDRGALEGTMGPLGPFIAPPDLEKAIRAYVRINQDRRALPGVRIFERSRARH